MKKYTFKVYPDGRGRDVYRVIEIAGSRTLDDLCDFIIATAFDFTHEHLYEFCMDNKRHSDNCYQCQPYDSSPSTQIAIDKIGLVKGQKFSLHYDYGDDWMFKISVQKIEDVNGRIASAIIKSKGKVKQYPDDEDEEA